MKSDTGATAPGHGLNLLIYPSDLKNASRVMKLATSLQLSGIFSATHAVGISAPSLPAEEEIAPGTHLVRISGSDRKGNLGRLAKAVFWQPRVFRIYKNQPVAAVAAESIAVLPLAARLARRTGAVLVYNPHELETETDTKKGVKRWIARFFERRYVPQAKVVSTVNGSIADWYAKRYQIRRPIVVMNVPVDDGTVSTLREQIGVDSNALLYVHTGNLGAGRNIPLILREFEQRPHLNLLFLGDGPLLKMVSDASARCPNIHHLPPVSPYSVVGQMRGADVGLCLMETGNSLNMRFATPNKLFEALFANTPSLTSDLVEARALLGGLSDTWVLQDVQKDLGSALDRISKNDVLQFLEDWRGVPSWDHQVEPLVNAYRVALTRSE